MMLLSVLFLFATSMPVVAAFGIVVDQTPSRSSSFGVSSIVDNPLTFVTPQNNQKQHLSLRTSDSRTNNNNCMLFLSSSSSDDETTTTNKQPVKIIIAGAPASGKGTQCERIRKAYGIVHLSTGDMLREAVAAKTAIGIAAKEYMDSGKLVPDDVIIGIVKERLKESDCQTSGWLLDGFPRTQSQAKALEESGIIADVFLFLNVPDDILIDRVIGRRTDPVTGKIYHLQFSPPPPDIADRLQHRSDDTKEKVVVRLEQFHANVNAVKDSYTDISTIIDGNQSPDIVSDQIMVAIESRMSGSTKVSS